MAGELRRIIKKLPVVGPLAVMARAAVAPRRPMPAFVSSAQYWDDRYAIGGNSGAGSYGRLARFKADVLNAFVQERGVESVVEFGCGDGAQLELANYPAYTGFDVSSTAVDLCTRKFAGRPNYDFFTVDHVDEREGSYDLSLSLDVIYHLIEDEVFDSYMRRLFAASRRFVIIYAYNFDKKFQAHERGRVFLDWCENNASEWGLFKTVKNAYPYDPRDPGNTSQSDFYLFEKRSKSK